MNVYDIIIRPIITERSMASTAEKKYVFEVATGAGKVEIKNAVETIFGVKGVVAPDADLLTICRDASVLEIVRTAQTGESADVVLMHGDLTAVSTAMALSRRTLRNIKQNLFWAFFYNLLGLPLAAGALYAINGMLLSPIIGGLAMSFSSVCVVSNALRLRNLKL